MLSTSLFVHFFLLLLLVSEIEYIINHKVFYSDMYMIAKSLTFFAYIQKREWIYALAKLNGHFVIIIIPSDLYTIHNFKEHLPHIRFILESLIFIPILSIETSYYDSS